MFRPSNLALSRMRVIAKEPTFLKKKIEKPAAVSNMTPEPSLFLFIVMFNSLCLLAQHKELKHVSAMQ